MKDPFEKDDNTAMIAAIVTGALVAGALAYLFFTDSGSESLRSAKRRFKDNAKDLASGIISDKTGIKKRTVKKVADHVAK